MELGILMVIGLYYPIIGGAERECQKHAESLKRLGCKVTVLTQYMKGLPEYEIVNGVSVYRKIKATTPWAITYLLSALRFMIRSRREYEIIQCYGIFYHTTACVIMKYLYRKKVLQRLECAGPNGDLGRINKIKCSVLIKLCWKKVDKFIAISKEILNDLVNCGVKKEKITYIPNSVDTDYYTPYTLKTWDSPKNILFVGRLTEQKGIDTLFCAMKEVIDKGINRLSLSLVGDGPLRGELERMVNDLGITKYVRFVGSTNDVTQYYQNSHILVIPSNWEGLPLVLLEGMACGLPILASDLDGIRDGIEDGVNGFLFTPGNASQLSSKITYLLENPEKAEEMGRVSREKAVALFSLRENMHKYVGVYKSLLGQ
ncbi:MAG: glycosyltransferase family 4 protein [Syntrophaceae bacterium]|nr:glycosyltransferase family 4 protein [Syntrophaceae bacterium]